MDLEFAIKVHSSISPKRIIALLLKSSKAVAFTLRSPQNAKTLVRFKRKRKKGRSKRGGKGTGINENENWTVTN